MAKQLASQEEGSILPELSKRKSIKSSACLKTTYPIIDASEDSSALLACRQIRQVGSKRGQATPTSRAWAALERHSSDRRRRLLSKSQKAYTVVEQVEANVHLIPSRRTQGKHFALSASAFLFGVLVH